MKLELHRKVKTPTYTIGKLYIDGVYQMDTLEDCIRSVKIANETAIPAGTYQVIINHSNRFNRLMPRLLNVPNFDGILIHSGNTPANTSGCLLVGKNTIKGQLTESKATFDKLFKILSDCKENISIKITDN